jgi:hypothetical protein
MLAILHRQTNLLLAWSLTRQFPLWRWIITVLLFMLFIFIQLEYASNADTSICAHAV